MPGGDRRVRRTRVALLNAFRDLFFERGFDAISIADIAERANVGRSTFYLHFTGKDHIISISISPLFRALADAVVTAEPSAELTHVIAHFWQNRKSAKTTFSGSTLEAKRRVLTRMIEERLGPLVPVGSKPVLPLGLAAHQIASAQLNLIVEWLAGRHSASAEAVAAAVHASSRALAGALVTGASR